MDIQKFLCSLVPFFCCLFKIRWKVNKGKIFMKIECKFFGRKDGDVVIKDVLRTQLNI